MQRQKINSRSSHLHSSCSPESFGKNAWSFLEASAFCARTNDKRKKIIAGLPYFGNMLPCEECSVNFRTELSNINFNEYMESNETMLKMIYDIHDSVNRRLGKVSPPFEEVLKYYINLEGDDYEVNVPCNKCSVDTTSNIDNTEEIKNYHNKMKKRTGKPLVMRKRT